MMSAWLIGVPLIAGAAVRWPAWPRGAGGAARWSWSWPGRARC